MILAKEDIEKAVSWWAGKLIDNKPHSNGDDSFTSVATCFLADMGRQSITLDQLNTFKKVLSERIEERMKEEPFDIELGCDYGPYVLIQGRCHTALFRPVGAQMLWKIAPASMMPIRNRRRRGSAPLSADQQLPTTDSPCVT